MKENKKYIELMWYQKYDEVNVNKRVPTEKTNLSFQLIERINQPRIKESLQQFLYPEKKWLSNYPQDRKNILIWNGNKLVMSSLIKQG